MKNTLLKTLLIGACLFQGLYTSAIATKGSGSTFYLRAPRVASGANLAGITAEAWNHESSDS